MLASSAYAYLFILLTACFSLITEQPNCTATTERHKTPVANSKDSIEFTMNRRISLSVLAATATAASCSFCYGFVPSAKHSLKTMPSSVILYINPMDKQPLDVEQEIFAQDVQNAETESAEQEASWEVGDSVPLSAKPSSSSSSQATEQASWKVGASVPLSAKPSSSSQQASTRITSSTSTNNESVSMKEDDSSIIQTQRKRNVGVAVASVVLAVSSYLWQFTHPVTPIQLLTSMERRSDPITVIGTNGKPTVVDFWAPWCYYCKTTAPTLEKIEQEYKGKVNFVMINGDSSEASSLIERFGVDSIPHLAMISAEGDVETALIGPIPRGVMEADLDALLEPRDSKNRQLPYVMLDAFVNRPEARRVHFDK